MLKNIMQKKPKIIAEKFHEFFNKQFQLGVIGALLGLIAVRFVGM
jgi:hypothetical protein